MLGKIVLIQLTENIKENILSDLMNKLYENMLLTWTSP